MNIKPIYFNSDRTIYKDFPNRNISQHSHYVEQLQMYLPKTLFLGPSGIHYVPRIAFTMADNSIVNDLYCTLDTTFISDEYYLYTASLAHGYTDVAGLLKMSVHAAAYSMTDTPVAIYDWVSAEFKLNVLKTADSNFEIDQTFEQTLTEQVETSINQNASDILTERVINNTQNDRLDVLEENQENDEQDIATLQTTTTAHTGNANIHVTTSDKSNWNGKVDKTTTVNAKPLSSNITLSGADINAEMNSSTKTVNQQLQALFTKFANYSTTSGVNTLISSAIEDLIGGAPSCLDTLKEIADSLNNQTDFASQVVTLLSQKYGIVEGVSISSNKVMVGGENGVVIYGTYPGTQYPGIEINGGTVEIFYGENGYTFSFNNAKFNELKSTNNSTTINDNGIKAKNIEATEGTKITLIDSNTFQVNYGEDEVLLVDDSGMEIKSSFDIYLEKNGGGYITARTLANTVDTMSTQFTDIVDYMEELI